MKYTHSSKQNFAVKSVAVAMMVFATLLLVPFAAAQNTGGNNAFAFNSDVISGFTTGKVLLTGGGSINFTTKTAHAGGSFNCLETVGQGPLSGCLSGEGVRWDTANIIDSVGFKCTGAAAEVKKTATTSTSKDDPDTVVLLADFYRNGDGNDESFTGQMIISSKDLAPEIEGIQNIWIEKVGCGTAIVNFNH